MTIDRPADCHISQLRELWREAFGDSCEFLDAFFTTAYSPARSLCVLDGSNVAAAVYWFDCELQGKKIAYLYALATAIAYRGQGIGHRLMDEVHSRLLQQGYEAVILVPGTEKLAAFYETMGYSSCAPMAEFVCTGAPDAVHLRRVAPEEYARQRRELFSLSEPAGVIQEGENLAFLAAQAELYSGKNFLLAAYGQGDTLVGIEFLGETQMAPGIVQALGYAKGSFRTRGQGRNFAMYRPLRESAPSAPAYFGLAFD